MIKRYCYYWGVAPGLWKNANWTWIDCELVDEICAKWGTEGVWWKNENLIWSKCTGSVSPPIPPITASVVIDRPGVDATTLVQPWLITPWNPYTANDEHDKKRKRLIKLICKIKGETYEEEKMAGTMNISVDDIKMVVKAISNIDLDVKFEE